MEQRVRAESPKQLLMKWLIPLGLCFMPVTVMMNRCVAIYNYAFKMDRIILKSNNGTMEGGGGGGGGGELSHVQKPLNINIYY